MNTAGIDHVLWPFVAMCLLAVAGWLLSIRLNDVSIVDSLWALFFLLFMWLFAWRVGSDTAAAWSAMTLVTLWGLRLSGYITWRNWGHGEDRRYQAIRARNQPYFALKSLYLVFLLQAVLALIVVMPVVPLLNGERSANLLTWAGWGLALLGGLYEAVADAQMARFKASAAAAGGVMDRGLWRYSRHPNYFGEAVFWWGIWLASASMGGAWTAFSPLLMNMLLLKVSGVPLLEADLQRRRPAHSDYVRRTSAMIPRSPREPTPR